MQIPHDLFLGGSDLFVGLGWEAPGGLDLDASIVVTGVNPTPNAGVVQGPGGGNQKSILTTVYYGRQTMVFMRFFSFTCRSAINEFLLIVSTIFESFMFPLHRVLKREVIKQSARGDKTLG
jgi:hypothetical protein